MKKVKILIADEIPLRHLNILSGKYFQTFIHFNISNEEIIKTYKDFDVIIIRSIRKIDRNYLSRCNHKIIATCSRGFDNIDTDFANKKNISIINALDGNSVSAAEHTIALILNIFKNINYSDYLVRNNKFKDTDFQRNELSGKTIGIIGIGKVGSKVAKLSKSFGMKLLINDIDISLKSKYKNFYFVDLEYLLSNSDIVTIHIPLNKANKKFISRRKIDLLRETAVFINTSRGGVVDEDYLIEALKREKIGFAGLDVFIDEPVINRKFRGLRNVLLTNHIAGKTEESKYKITKEVFEQITYYHKKQVDFNKKSC